MLILSGCSIAMALHGNKEPNFEHIKVGAPKEEKEGAPEIRTVW
jgi:hypothetical protein